MKENLTKMMIIPLADQNLFLVRNIKTQQISFQSNHYLRDRMIKIRIKAVIRERS